jgi:formylglycine-generating enzyme required for sulfatase activity
MIAIPGKNHAFGKYEVTQAEWESVMGNNPSSFKGASLPVENVSWNDAQEYILKLNKSSGQQYHLPTEAEWEDACHGGNKTVFCGGEDVNAVAWYEGNSDKQTHPAGLKQPNAYGLHDMSGNVCEWMEDCWEGNCERRVRRGGSWDNPKQVVTANQRFGEDVSLRSSSIGFRLARKLP